MNFGGGWKGSKVVYEKVYSVRRFLFNREI